MVMDSFDLNKQEQLPNLPSANQIGEIPASGVERPLLVPDRDHERLTQSVIGSAGSNSQSNSHSVSSSTVPTSTVIRQPIAATERFKNLEVSDGDVIESTWVSNVKKTLEMTKNQPSRRDDEIKEIRKIYQEKRKAS